MPSPLAYVTNVLTAAAVSLAAITAAPAPAAADDKDLLRALAGIAAVAVIAGAIEKNNRGNQRVTRQQPVPQAQYPAWRDDYPAWRDDRNPRPGFYQQPQHRVDRRGPRLPAVCALEVGNGYPTTYYTEACLRREGVARGLPGYCAQQIRSRDWQGRVYEAECLRDAGYRIERWR